MEKKIVAIVNKYLYLFIYLNFFQTDCKRGRACTSTISSQFPLLNATRGIFWRKNDLRAAYFHFFFFFFPLSSLPPTIQRDRLSAAAASGVGHVGRVALIDAQKIRLTHLAATSRIPMRNITLTNDFRRCVKRSHCSAAEVGR